MRNRSGALVIGVLAAGMLVACSSSGGNSAPSSTPTSADDGHGSGPAWSYSGTNGPANWSNLSPSYQECSVGKQQSPINIINPQPGNEPAPIAAYQGNSADVINNGHTIEMGAVPGSTLSVNGKIYPLEQVHFHAPSENVVAGKKYPIEFHFVNQAADHSAAVLAVFATPGAANPAWQPFIDAALPLKPGEDSVTVIKMDWAKLVPGLHKSLRYTGSLTTPGCTEGIAWAVAPNPITLSQAQIDALTSIYDHNARPVQPLNGRSITITK